MVRITVLETTALSGETEAILKEIEGAVGMVPNLFRTYAHHAPLLKANWNKVLGNQPKSRCLIVSLSSVKSADFTT